MSHTPGPWKIVDLKKGGETQKLFVEADQAFICDMLYGEANHGQDEIKANARLIAAAPELLEALIRVTVSLIAAISLLKNGGKQAAASNKMFVQMLTDYERAIEMSRVAKAKAEGKG